MDILGAIEVVCRKFKNGTHYCVGMPCKKDYNCPEGTVCQENSRETFCSGKNKALKVHKHIFLILKLDTAVFFNTHLVYLLLKYTHKSYDSNIFNLQLLNALRMMIA